MSLSAERHREYHRQAQAGLEWVVARYLAQSGQRACEATLRDLLGGFQAPVRPEERGGAWQRAWQAMDKTLACYIHTEWSPERLMTAPAGMLESTTLEGLVEWNRRMGREAPAQEWRTRDE